MRPQVSEPVSERHAWLFPPAVGLIAALLVAWSADNTFILINDEGIYLAGAEGLMRGEAPYRDFFLISGPGTLWMLAGLFQLLGMTLRAARVLLVLEFGVLAACICWIASRVSSRGRAVAVALLFVAGAFAHAGLVSVNHRWDSSMFAVAAAAAALWLVERPGPVPALVSGSLAAWAAWCTPNVALVGIAIGAFLLMAPALRRSFVPFAAGVAVASAIPALVLAAQGALGPMLSQMLWSAANYSDANRMAYGSVAGGWSAMLAGPHGGISLPVVFLAVGLLPSAVLPVAVFVGWGVLLWRSAERNRPGSKTICLLLACSAAHLVSSYPRMDVGHLYYVTPLSWVLLAALLSRRWTDLRGSAALVVTAVIVVQFALSAAIKSVGLPALETRVGRVRGSARDVALMRQIQETIRPGQGLFVFPYAPAYYFLTGGVNPTRYLYLQPGMMSDEDERAALAQLQAAPPRWVLLTDVAPEEYLRIWPSSDPSRLRMPSLETFFRDRYEVRRILEGGLQVLELRGLAPTAGERR